MNQFDADVQYQRQIVADRHQRVRREFGASRTRHVSPRQRRRARPGPSR